MQVVGPSHHGSREVHPFGPAPGTDRVRLDDRGVGELSAVEEWGSSQCADAAAFYRRKLAWPCTAAGHAVWTLAGEAVDAVDLPKSARYHLMRGDQAVIEVPGDEVCLRFLVRPRRATPHPVVRELARQGAVYHGHASMIELPPTRVPGGELRWLRGPGESLPSLAELLTEMLRSEHKSSER
jgi:hypothetical protein